MRSESPTSRASSRRHIIACQTYDTPYSQAPYGRHTITLTRHYLDWPSSSQPSSSASHVVLLSTPLSTPMPTTSHCFPHIECGTRLARKTDLLCAEHALNQPRPCWPYSNHRLAKNFLHAHHRSSAHIASAGVYGVQTTTHNSTCRKCAAGKPLPIS